MSNRDLASRIGARLNRETQVLMRDMQQDFGAACMQAVAAGALSCFAIQCAALGVPLEYAKRVLGEAYAFENLRKTK